MLLPVTLGSNVPLIVIVIALPAPAFTLAPMKLKLFPDEAFVPQLAVPWGAHAIVGPTIDAGTRSATSSVGACDGPRSVTVSVYDTAVPDTYPARASLFVIARSARPAPCVSVSVALLFAG